MRVQFWGTRGSIPATVRYGGNTSRVELMSEDGTLEILDYGTGAHSFLSCQARTCFGSALEGNKAPESRIGETVLSSFDVTRKLVFEIRVSANPYDEVVPTKELIQHQLV
jgi:hypothetical protein